MQLQMLGFDMNWAAFNIIEVMSSTKFTFKRIGYLAASQSFHEGTEVITLATNLIRKVSVVFVSVFNHTART
jgi:AP-3 complex subunit delta-1